jgi:cysteine-rich repeat protein
VPISRYGADCDPARVVSVCAEGTTCVPLSQHMYPTPWTCVARCGDGRLDPDEACDRAENGVCGPGCTAPVATCEEPADLSAAFNSQFLSAIWRGPGLPGPVAVARFEARYAGNYLFTYEPSDYAGALALYPGDGCGDAARELGRATGFPGEPVALARTLAEREAVFLGLEGPAGAPFRLTAKLREGMCGNGSVLDGHTEECDDGNTISGDGCSELCLVERAEGEACSASPVTAYLDGKLLPSDGDDTAPSCLADAGSVDASRRFVAPEAGRYEFRARIERGPAALTLRDEACGPVEHGCTPLHEGYTQATPGVLLRDLGDGEAVAVVVDGPAGARFSLAIERVSCGDGLTAASEECDGQDYCLADCRVGPGEREPNDTPAQAELPDAAPRRAHLASATDVDTWMVHTPEEAWGPVVRRVRLGLGTPGGCFPPGPGHDFLRLRLVGENGQLLAEVRSPGPGRCPELNFQATSGGIDYVQVVRGADAGDGPIGPYFLRW